MSKLLVVDDDRTVQRLIAKALAEADISTVAAGSAHEGITAVKQESPDVLLLDIQLPDGSGLEIAEQVREIDPKLPIIFITVSDKSDTAIEAMKLGAYEFLLKPLDVEQVRDVVARAMETRRMMSVPVAMSEIADSDDAGQDFLVGRSSEMLEVYKEVGRVATQDVTVLICGESGTGKELVARAVYQHSVRKDRPFLAVNCAALSETLLESELFGHEKGAFTGADQQRVGKFEQCSGGTIFLDEVGDMSPLVQSKVLRLLQEQKFERVGGRETIETDVRIISATNRDLEHMIDDGEFRLDLYHRLNGYRIDLPPLRSRGKDVERLIEHFVAKFSRDLQKEIQGISPETLALLTQYHWPGNIRELQTVLRKTVLKSTGPVLVPEFLPSVLSRGDQLDERAAKTQTSTDGTPPSDLAPFVRERHEAGTTALYGEAVEMMERYLITWLLTENGGHQSNTAQELGISRGSLRNKIRLLGISIEQKVTSDDGSIE